MRPLAARVSALDRFGAPRETSDPSEHPSRRSRSSGEKPASQGASRASASLRQFFEYLTWGKEFSPDPFSPDTGSRHAGCHRPFVNQNEIASAMELGSGMLPRIEDHSADPFRKSRPRRDREPLSSSSSSPESEAPGGGAAIPIACSHRRSSSACFGSSGNRS